MPIVNSFILPENLSVPGIKRRKLFRVVSYLPLCPWVSISFLFTLTFILTEILTKLHRYRYSFISTIHCIAGFPNLPLLYTFLVLIIYSYGVLVTPTHFIFQYILPTPFSFSPFSYPTLINTRSYLIFICSFGMLEPPPNHACFFSIQFKFKQFCF